MSDKSFPQKPGAPRHNHLQSDAIPFSLASPQYLAQFSAATASGYHPRAQNSTVKQPYTQTTGKGSLTTDTYSDSPSMSAATASAFPTASQSLQPPPAQPIDLSVFKGLKFVTLDQLQLETRDVYDEISGTFQWEMCESDEERCVKYIKEQCGVKRVFLVSSGGLGKKIVPQVHDLPQVYAIYIYCADVLYHQEWASKFSKIRTVCNDDDKYLLPQLAVDVAQSNLEWGTAFLKQNKREDAKKKFQKALDNLTKYAKHSDPIMVNEAKRKLEECK
jgi:hypothetical protein